MGSVMKNPNKSKFDLASPRQQHNWDWRAASNFIAGGAGGSLLWWVSFASLAPDTTRIAMLLGLGLIGGGLTCVWFEIGRPWRALNVYRHIATSWMTREAVVALAVFSLGGLALLTLWPIAVMLAGIAGLVFVYSQARILAANKGIPAWRHPRSVPLMIATGLVEGAGFLACIAALAPGAAITGIPALLIVLIGIRAFFWKNYLAGLVADGVPEGALRALNSIASRFLILGHVVPVVAVAAGLAGIPGQHGLLAVAGIMAAVSGGYLKYSLVLRAAFNQGLAMPHMPVRGQGTAGPAAKPGWKSLPGANAG